jgi:MFS family permease
VPLYLMAVRGFSPVRAGVGLFPAVCLLVPGSVVVAILTTRLGRYRWAIWAGWAITTIASGLFLLFDLRTAWPVFAVALVVFGVGNGMVLTSVNVGIQAMSKAEDCAMAASMYGFMRSVGMPLGVAVSSRFPPPDARSRCGALTHLELSGNLFQNAMARRLPCPCAQRPESRNARSR